MCCFNKSDQIEEIYNDSHLTNVLNFNNWTYIYFMDSLFMCLNVTITLQVCKNYWTVLSLLHIFSNELSPIFTRYWLNPFNINNLLISPTRYDLFDTNKHGTRCAGQVCIVQPTVCSVQWVVYSVQRTVCSIQCAVFSMQC